MSNYTTIEEQIAAKKRQVEIQQDETQEAFEQEAMADDSPASTRKANRAAAKLKKLQAELAELMARAG